MGVGYKLQCPPGWLPALCHDEQNQSALYLRLLFKTVWKFQLVQNLVPRLFAAVSQKGAALPLSGCLGRQMR